MKFKDYYQTLGVERTATDKEIKQAYRKLAHQYHPDVSKDPKGEEKFKDIAEAYATLKDPEKRDAYDRLGKHSINEDFTPPPDWRRNFHTEDADLEGVDLSDLFAAFGRTRRGGRAREDYPMAGQDYEIASPVTLEQISRGEHIEVRAEMPELDRKGQPHRVTRTFHITIPKTAADGQRLRLGGKGGAGANGGKPGDLYVALALQTHRLFKLNGRDLFIDLPLAPWEAVLGTSVTVPTLGGAVELKIKPGTTSGQKLRLSNLGLASTDGSTGALYAVVDIVVPKLVTAREQELLEQLAKVSSFKPREHF
ncbi:DnaJ C-terminal domain-containing protein [Paraburkholderia sp.]|uniref:DnaJ C-terminal domain-containing protein n=1 Tax=Paraburkholderia sp. TaxID=1926495 RepID=UPI00239C05C9|nr:DnaJ C-terminal domain-containing protein [Paraburkholderia sp.]MDE1182409.1 DnaJ C-terminal domain-containing protein [Paraburkholderia sp.]